MDNLIIKVREQAVNLNRYQSEELTDEFVKNLCKFLKDFNILSEMNIDESLSVLWYFVSEKTFEDKRLSKHKILALIDNQPCKEKFVEFYHFLGKVYEAVEKMEKN